MTGEQIKQEIIRYLKDESYNYAVLVDGEWGSGKTYFAKNILAKEIEQKNQEDGNERGIKYLSLYGCKNLSDIEDKFTWTFAEEFAKRLGKKHGFFQRKDTTSDIILDSALTIGNSVSKNLPFGIPASRIAVQWLEKKRYVFLVDDLERCECQINEVFGFFNELVEHKNAKVIFFANEKEIVGTAEPNNVELQYNLSLNEKVDWPKPESALFYPHSQSNQKVTIDEMNRRRRLLFPEKGSDSLYPKVREKVIGVVLRYEPDVNSIMGKMIESLDCDNSVRLALQECHDYYCCMMKTYNHCNLRTFQFFLSRACNVLREVDKLCSEYKHKEIVLRRMTECIFQCAVLYKSNYKKESLDLWEDLNSPDVTSPVIKSYVEQGNLDVSGLGKKIEELKAEVEATIQPDDPFIIVNDEYYLRTQKECENAMELLLGKISKDEYPITMYAKIVLAIQRLIAYGFDGSYVERAIDAMLANIDSAGEIKEIEPDYWYLAEGEFKETVLGYIERLNDRIRMHSNNERCETIRDILSKDDWVELLKSYINPNGKIYLCDMVIFSKASTDEWINALNRATPKELYSFHSLLYELYPDGKKRDSYEVDGETLVEIQKYLGGVEEEDIIRRLDIQWIVEKIGRIAQFHSKEVDSSETIVSANG